MFTFSPMDIVAMVGVAVALCGLILGVSRHTNSQIHGRIKEVKNDLEAEIKEIRETYAQKVELNQALSSIREGITNVISEQRNTSSRVDDIFKLITSFMAGKKD